MSIESKHAYRFGYLKSEEWKTVRLEALAREGGKCQICGEESIHNDAHHIWYPENIKDTREFHLAILCRTCHNFIHDIVPECKTNDEAEGIAHWSKFRNAIKAWRADKARIFDNGTEIGSARELRVAYMELKEKYDKLLNGIVDQKDLLNKSGKAVDVFKIIKAWEAAYNKLFDIR